MSYTRRRFLQTAGAAVGASALPFPTSTHAQSGPIRVGLVTVKTTGVNQHGTPIIEFKRTFMVWKKGHVPGRR